MAGLFLAEEEGGIEQEGGKGRTAEFAGDREKARPLKTKGNRKNESENNSGQTARQVQSASCRLFPPSKFDF